ncbi:MAG: RNA polymerase sigma factor [Gammaproteobacteria bacterium]|nr:RNA polymerase sigma factor [Gammaproteobacteria bacterium]
MDQAKEDLLVLSAQIGDTQAFGALFNLYQAPLLRFSFNVCGNLAMAKDAVQEAWIKCAKSIKRLKDPRAFKSWMYRSVRWRTIDLMRKSRTDHSSLDDVPEEQLIATSRESNQGNEELVSKMAELSDIDRQALHLFYLEEMKISEIAVVLAIPPGTVKSRLNRARRVLREKLEN